MLTFQRYTYFLQRLAQGGLVFALWFWGMGWAQAVTPVLSVAGFGDYQENYAVDSAGMLWGWGRNAKGAFGDGVSFAATPVQIGGGYREVHLDGMGVYALRADGSLWVWPLRWALLYGESASVAPSGPLAPISLGGGYTTIPKGLYFLKRDGDEEMTIACPGFAWRGKEATDAVLTELRQACGRYAMVSDRNSNYVLAIKPDSSLWSWSGMQCDNNDNVIGSSQPRLIGVGYRAAVAGRFLSAALKTDGSLWIWGCDFGAGPESTKQRLLGAGYVDLALDGSYIVALKSDGTLWTWRAIPLDRLGDGTMAEMSKPRLIGGGYRAIAMSGWRTVALKSDGGVHEWEGLYYDNSETPAPLSVKTADGAPFNLGASTLPSTLPMTLTATPGDGSVDLQWTYGDVRDGVSTIYRDGNFVTTLNGQTQFKDVGLKLDTSYRYIVIACDSASNCSAQEAQVKTPMPIDLSATPLGAKDVELSWKYIGDRAKDIKSFRIYRGERGETLLAELSDGYRYRDVEPNVGFNHYRIEACDVNKICWTQSWATAEIGPGLVYLPASNALKFAPGWNLMGNSGNRAIDVRSAFGDAAKVLSVWTWSSKNNTWAFYTPAAAVADGGVAFAQSKGYAPLTTIDSGEGFWLNAATDFELTLKASNVVSSNVAFYRLTQGWNLLAVGDNPALRDLYLDENLPPSVGLVGTTGQVRSVWAWDAARSQWKFYAPSLERQGVLADYIASKGYLPFGADTLAPATGFWMNYRAKDATSGAPQSGAEP